MRDAAELQEAYRHCWTIARNHYENFPLGSYLLPRRLRDAIAAIYAFARVADDLADEGEKTPDQRLAALDAWEAQLDACVAGQPESPIFVALADTIQRFSLAVEPFKALLEAFRYDAQFRPFATYADLLQYCTRSANPVGHLVLCLFGYRDAERQQLADRICTGLQLANFWQDVSVDAARGRVYLPKEELQRFGLSIGDILEHGADRERFRGLMEFQVARARTLLESGLSLAEHVSADLAREVRLFAHGGLAILDRIVRIDYDVLHQRPTLSAWDKARLLWQFAKPTPRRPFLLLDDRSPTSLQRDYRYCEEVTRRSSSNFYYAFHLLPAQKRRALYAVYAFCRFVDDVADRSDPAWSPAAGIQRWRDEVGAVFHGTPRHPISRALADSVRRFPLQERYFHELIDGVETDLRPRSYETWEELRTYCYRVASTVGLLCIEIFGYLSPSARQYAIDLGIAFQLTNILRDVREDAERGRIYIPRCDLVQFDCSEGDLLQGRYSSRVASLLAFECGRARAYYLRARAALAPEDQRSLAAAEAMRLIYQRLLARIEAQNFDVFRQRVTLPRYEKVSLALAAWGRSQLQRPA
ncbi:MAG: presqualene diphosphate synthase HpnD [Candidatus Binatia bacterium]|nr:presqualene diphosphate synthase HpnD [Candidatus Binatia bacterium]